MVEELSRISRPAASNYQGKRKLLLAPLLQPPVLPQGMPPEGVAIMERYWEQVDVQVRALQNALGSVARVYHESIPEGGPEAMEYLEVTEQASHGLVQGLLDAGATLEAVESMALLAETLDLQRCLMQPLMSAAVANRLAGMVRGGEPAALRAYCGDDRRDPGGRRDGAAADQRAASGAVSGGYGSDLHRPAGAGRVPSLAPQLDRADAAGDGDAGRGGLGRRGTGRPGTSRPGTH